jgi:hypothetical protein
VGPELLGVILSRLPIPVAVVPFVSALIILATTIAVPFWLMTYRKQNLRDFGFDQQFSAAGLGFVAALPVAAAYILSSLAGGTGPFVGLPIVDAVQYGAIVEVALSVFSGLCITLLVIYATVKARSAFRTDPAYIPATMRYLGRFAAIVAAVASGLLMMTVIARGLEVRETLQVVLVPLAVAAAAWIVYRSVRGSQLTNRATLLTPMVLLAIGSFVIFAEALDIVFGVWRATVLGGVGLIVGVLLESRRTAWAPLGFALGLVLLTPLLR